MKIQLFLATRVIEDLVIIFKYDVLQFVLNGAVCMTLYSLTCSIALVFWFEIIPDIDVAMSFKI